MSDIASLHNSFPTRCAPVSSLSWHTVDARLRRAHDVGDMRTSKFSDAQIVGILQEAEAGLPVAEVIRKHGIARATYFTWKAKYANATVPELTRLRERGTCSPWRGHGVGQVGLGPRSRSGSARHWRVGTRGW